MSLNRSLTIKIADFEEEENLVVHTFPRELVHCLDKFRDTDSAAAVGVKEAEGPLHEKEIFRGDDFLELCYGELLLASAKVVAEDALEVLQALFAQLRSLPAK